MLARANIDDLAFFGCVFWGSRYFWRLMRGEVFDDFRNCLMDVLQPSIVQTAQRRVGFGQAQRTKQYLVIVVLDRPPLRKDRACSIASIGSPVSMRW